MHLRLPKNQHEIRFHRKLRPSKEAFLFLSYQRHLASASALKSIVMVLLGSWLDQAAPRIDAEWLACYWRPLDTISLPCPFQLACPWSFSSFWACGRVVFPFAQHDCLRVPESFPSPLLHYLSACQNICPAWWTPRTLSPRRILHFGKSEHYWSCWQCLHQQLALAANSDFRWSSSFAKVSILMIFNYLKTQASTTSFQWLRK